MENKIIINLDESSNAKSYDKDNLIHQREFNRAKDLIESRIKKSDTKDKIRYNDTISILGSRGSGKTSFLLSLLANYKDSKEVEVLDIIDPTLIEEKGHIFLTVISLIEESVSQKLNLSDCSPNDSNYHQKKDWKDKLRKLADGLPSMDGVGSSLEHSDWQDAEFILDRGLKSVKAATNLETNFNELIKFALDILGKEKKAFIVTLDDIDVDFRKGWPVLETIRKYLTSPQIIVLLSGDLKLYAKAIRKQQWKNFGKALLKNEAEFLNRMDGYNDLVTEMEGQYMQKVIKPENRIHLNTILEKVTTYSSEIKIVILSGDFEADGELHKKELKIQEYYDEILSNFGIHNSYQAEAYTSFLLSLPVRTQIQFLSSFSHNNSDVTDAFLSDLYEKEVDVDLAKNMPKLLNVVILKLLMKERVLAEAYQLQPTTTDTSLNSSLTALSFLFSLKVQKTPFLIFDYFIKIGYIRNLLPNVGFAEKDNKNAISLLKPSIEGLCYHSGIFQDKVLRDVVGNIIAYIESTLNSQEKQIGNINLYGVAGKANASKEESKGRIDFELKGKSSLQQILAFIPLSISQNLIQNTTTITFSIYTLIASIGELIRKIEMDDMGRGLLELSQLRTYPMISFIQGSTNTSDMGELDGIEITKDGESSKLDSYFKNWYLKFPKKKYSPHVLGKISTRIHYTFNSIKNEQNIDENLAKAIHRRLVALMNAILIEDVRENMPNCNELNINNAVKADKIFLDNLKVAEENMDNNNFDFSRWMLSCPLFLLYLNVDLLGNEYLKKYIYPVIEDKVTTIDWESINSTEINQKNRELGELNIETLKKKSVYTILNQVLVKQKKRNIDSVLIDFSYAKKKARTTIEILRGTITYDDFMTKTLKDVKLSCESLFKSGVYESSIRLLREFVKTNNIKW